MPDEQEELRFRAERWILKRILYHGVDVFDELVELIPLPKAARDPRLLVFKFALPQILALFPSRPKFSELGVVDPLAMEVADLLELWWTAKPIDAVAGAGDKALELLSFFGRSSQINAWGTAALWSPLMIRDP